MIGPLNLLRGRGILPRWAMFLLAGAHFGAEAQSPFVGGVVALGLAVWMGAGWGNGLIAVTGRDTRDPAEVPWLHRLTERLVPDPRTDEDFRRWGGIFMAGRGLFLLPLFAGLAWHAGSTLPLLFGLGALNQGFTYYACGHICKERYAVAAAEFLFGLWLSLLIGWST